MVSTDIPRRSVSPPLRLASAEPCWLLKASSAISIGTIFDSMSDSFVRAASRASPLSFPVSSSNISLARSTFMSSAAIWTATARFPISSPVSSDLRMASTIASTSPLLLPLSCSDNKLAVALASSIVCGVFLSPVLMF